MLLEHTEREGLPPLASLPILVTSCDVDSIWECSDHWPAGVTEVFLEGSKELRSGDLAFGGFIE